MNRARRAAFLKALAETGSVTAASMAAGIERREALACTDEDETFALRWADALETYVEALEAEADRRGVAGIDKGVYYQGARIDTVRDYSDALLVLRLKALKPDKYRERAAGAPPNPAATGASLTFTLNWVKPGEGGDEG
ncbi:MAG: terminase [Rhodospirillales bacterium]|nr:terminase [Rhodospirillales bacterium]